MKVNTKTKMNNYQCKIYNGVNHDIVIYSPDDAATDRYTNHFYLKNKEAKPIEIIPQQRPLNARKNLTPINNSNESSIPLFQDILDFSTVDSLAYFDQYDIIIVSSIYAMQACKVRGNNPDFLDRLFIPNPLYDSADSTEKCGSVGLTKFLFPKNPWQYLEELRMGGRPSIAAMQYCLYIYGPYAANAEVLSYLNELQWRLAELLSDRQSFSQYSGRRGGDYYV